METLNLSSEFLPFWGHLVDISVDNEDMYDELSSSFPAANHNRPSSVAVADLPSVRVIPDDMVNDVCSICMEDFVGGRTAKRVPCGHVYHGDCISSWLSHSDSCPLCRTSVSSSLPEQ